MDLQDLRGFQRELEKGRKARNACSSPLIKASPSLICQKVAIILKKKRTSLPEPSGFRGIRYQPPRRSRGSPPPSASINNSTAGGVPGFLSDNSRAIGRTMVPKGADKVPLVKPVYGRARNSSRKGLIFAGVIQSRVLGQGGVQLKANSSKSSSAPALENGRIEAESASATIKTPARSKGSRKRKRLSRKPPIETLMVTPEDFRPTVQRLTGYNGPPCPEGVPPQPERLQAEAVPSSVSSDEGLDSCEDAPARPDSSSTSTMSAVHSPPPPSVSDRVPEAPFLIPDSLTAVTASLNDSMGYGPDTPRFLEESCYNENLGQLLDGSPQPTSSVRDYHSSEPIQHKKREESVQEAAVLLSDGNGREGIPREQGCSGFDFDSGSLLSHHDVMTPSVLVLDRRHKETSGFGMEFDQDAREMADSFINDWGD